MGLKFLACVLVLTATCVSADSFEDLSQKANTARSENRLPEAIGLYKEALTANPAWAEGWWSLGGCLYATHQYADAVTAFAKLAELQPSAAPAWALKGLSELQLGDNTAALADIEKSISLGGEKLPQFGDTLRTNQALLLNVAGKYEQSLRILSSFVQGGPNPALVDALGIAGLRRPLLPAQIPVQDHELVSSAGQAVFWMLSKRPDEADKQFQRLINDFPAAPGVHYLYGYYLFGSNPVRASEEFRRELQISSDNSAAASMLAYTLLLSGDTKAALPLAQAAVSHDPASASAQYVLGRVLVKTGDYNAGVSALEKSVQLDPENLESRISLATAYALAKRYQEARRARQEALRLDSDNVAVSSGNTSNGSINAAGGSNN
ncbi:MAG TPA: tetratricopeptide repeat protein [Bryobacteraceae bacterium]|jgi:tetratricopeptide (TPR) repeat protein|nr:tetratricopeptide repeat protein [Bryobacteraceae bacterium]